LEYSLDYPHDFWERLVHYFVARWPMTARSSTRAKEKDPVGKIKIETGYMEFRCIREQEYGS
jgi:hypothetical protein